MAKDLFLRQAYTHKGITVVLEIDCEKKNITFVERDHNGKYKPKKWVFAERTREYLGGWILILDAMAYAIKEANKLLEELDKRDEEKFVAMLMALADPKLKPEAKDDLS